jgi:hypothetical protein
MLESDEENESDESSVPQADDSADLSEESDRGSAKSVDDNN